MTDTDTTTLLSAALENEAKLLLKLISELENEDLYDFIRRISELKVQSSGTTLTDEILYVAQNVRNIARALDSMYTV